MGIFRARLAATGCKGLTSLERTGKRDSFACHHFKGFVLVPSTGSLRKRSTSSCGLLSSFPFPRLSPRRKSMATIVAFLYVHETLQCLVILISVCWTQAHLLPSIPASKMEQRYMYIPWPIHIRLWLHGWMHQDLIAFLITIHRAIRYTMCLEQLLSGYVCVTFW